MCNCSDAVGAARRRPDCDRDTTVHCRRAAIRFMFDDGDANADNDRTLTFLNVSNLVSTANLPGGFGPNADGTADPDHFKIEIDDTGKGGGTIPAAEVTLEVLRPGAGGALEAFNPPRRLQVECQRISGSTGGPHNKYRSRYLRLVVDDVDRAASATQCLLTD